LPPLVKVESGKSGSGFKAEKRIVFLFQDDIQRFSAAGGKFREIAESLGGCVDSLSLAI